MYSGRLSAGCKIVLIGDLTQLFEAVRSSDQRALGEVFAITYDELRSLARQRLRHGWLLTAEKHARLVPALRHMLAQRGQIERGDFLATIPEVFDRRRRNRADVSIDDCTASPHGSEEHRTIRDGSIRAQSTALAAARPASNAKRSMLRLAR